jgi:hypothetical protein
MKPNNPALFGFRGAGAVGKFGTWCRKVWHDQADAEKPAVFWNRVGTKISFTFMADISLTNPDSYALESLCLHFDKGTSIAKVSIKDASSSSFKDYILSAEGLAFLVSGATLQVSKEYTWNVPKFFTSKGKLSGSRQSKFMVTRAGGGIGIADIRDGAQPFRYHIYRLSICPVVLKEIVEDGARMLVFEIACKSANCAKLVPRPNTGYDFFIPDEDECS